MVLFIVGPTASGKSSLALKAAELLNTEIISADSMQIYRGMDIGTAKESLDVRKRIKHYLIDIINPDAEFSVAEYQIMASNIIQNLLNENKIPIICGGTGLYIESLLYPMSFAGAGKNDELRLKLEYEYDTFGGETMYNKLLTLSPEVATKLHPNDKKRIVRAMEIIVLGGEKINTELNKPSFEYLMLNLNGERAELYNRINSRVEDMFKYGLLNEVEKLLSEGYSFDNQAFEAIGYKEFADYFNNTATIDEVKENIKKHTRNYAKRQITWFKRYKNAVCFDFTRTDSALKYIEEKFLEKN